jgi:hypothetical protein
LPPRTGYVKGGSFRDKEGSMMAMHVPPKMQKTNSLRNIGDVSKKPPIDFPIMGELKLNSKKPIGEQDRHLKKLSNLQTAAHQTMIQPNKFNQPVKKNDKKGENKNYPNSNTKLLEEEPIRSNSLNLLQSENAYPVFKNPPTINVLKSM